MIVNPPGSSDQTVTPSARTDCVDEDVCKSLPNICTDTSIEADLKKTLCPVKCGFCPGDAGPNFPVNPPGVSDQTVTPSAPTDCVDEDLCKSLPNICTDTSVDADLKETLCPVKCGFCPGDAGPNLPVGATTAADTCFDTPDVDCSVHAQDVCSIDVGFWVCRETCGLCEENPDKFVCTDDLVGLRCADLPDPCNDELGRISCPAYCGICQQPNISMSIIS